VASAQRLDIISLSLHDGHSSGQSTHRLHRTGRQPRRAYQGSASRGVRQADWAGAGQEKIDLIVIAGDLYDGNWRDYQTGLFFVGQMRRLAVKEVPVHLHHGTSVDEDEPQVITEPVEVPGG